MVESAMPSCHQSYCAS